MKVVNYFEVEDKEFWKKEIQKSDWGAGKYLYRLLENDKVQELFGESTKVFMLIEQKTLISFCTLAEQDEIREPSLTPWIGFVYTFPEFRGNGYIGKLLDYAKSVAKEQGEAQIYISTNHIGLYEKYGYSFYNIMKDDQNVDSRVYKLDLV